MKYKFVLFFKDGEVFEIHKRECEASGYVEAMIQVRHEYMKECMHDVKLPRFETAFSIEIEVQPFNLTSHEN